MANYVRQIMVPRVTKIPAGADRTIHTHLLSIVVSCRPNSRFDSRINTRKDEKKDGNGGEMSGLEK